MIWYAADALHCSEQTGPPDACYAAEDGRCHCHFDFPSSFNSTSQKFDQNLCNFNDTRCSHDNWKGCKDEYTGIMLPWDYSGSACFSEGGGDTWRGFFSTCLVSAGLGWSLGLALLLQYRRHITNVLATAAAAPSDADVPTAEAAYGAGGQGRSRYRTGYAVAVQGEMTADEDIDRMMSQHEKTKSSSAAGGSLESTGLPVASPI